MFRSINLSIFLILIGIFAVNSQPNVPFVPCLQLVGTVCNKCITNYTLQDGRCFVSTTCPARQYFRYGKCLDVNPLCGDFDFYTGLCRSCANNISYIFNNVTGACDQVIVICAQRQYKINQTCFNVSSNCGARFDPANGKCIDCASNLYQLNADGTCTLIILNCPTGQYQNGLVCTNIPRQCVDFDLILKKCKTCIGGFQTDTNGVCIRIPCPPRFFYSIQARLCQEVSKQCNLFDDLTGYCLTCINPNFIVIQGQCKRAVNPLSSCLGKQNLGYGIDCSLQVNGQNCKTYDLEKSQCFECQTNYYLNHDFRCVLKPVCTNTEYLINNQCRKIPLNCLRVNQFGYCLQCNANFRLIVYECVFDRKCQANQYLNSVGQCVDVNPNCATFNPSNGHCITCPDGSLARQGLCCPTGQTLSGTVCVNALDYQLASQTATGQSCILKHPFVEICLKCAEGYAPDYILPYGCVKQ